MQTTHALHHDIDELKPSRDYLGVHALYSHELKRGDELTTSSWADKILRLVNGELAELSVAVVADVSDESLRGAASGLSHEDWFNSSSIVIGGILIRSRSAQSAPRPCRLRLRLDGVTLNCRRKKKGGSFHCSIRRL